MSKAGNILKIAGAVVAVVVIAFVTSWWSGRSSPGKTPSSDVAETPLEFKPAPPPAGSGLTKANPATTASVRPQSAMAQTNLIVDWEDKVDQILIADGEAPNKAKQMLEMFPRLPEDGQSEVAQHLSNLVPDEDYASLRKLLTDASLPESVLDVLLADALNRPNSLKLPSLLDVARDPQNPKAGEAKEVLQLFLDEDYGSDWTTWQAKMDAWLKDNPD